MSPKAIADPKVKTPGLFRSTSLARTPPGSISSAILSTSHFSERTSSTTSDSDEIEREDTPMRNVLTARKKHPVSTPRVEESGSPILQDEQEPEPEPATSIPIDVHQTDHTRTRQKTSPTKSI